MPYRFIQQTVEVRLSERTVEIFARSQRTALHPCSHQQGGLHHGPGPSARVPPAAFGMAPKPIDWLGRTLSRAAVCRRRAPHPRTQTASGDGIPLLSRFNAAEPSPWPQPFGAGACQRALLSDLCKYPSINPSSIPSWKPNHCPRPPLPLWFRLHTTTCAAATTTNNPNQGDPACCMNPPKPNSTP